MKSFLLSVLAPFVFAGSVASAQCGEVVVADCGDFRITSSACTEEVVTLTANFKDEKIGSIKFERKVLPDRVQLRGVINSDQDVYVDVSKEMGPKGREADFRDSYSTYKIAWGKKSESVRCESLLSR